ncbi:MAG: ATP-binding protein [Candidatus Brocadiales bacterium]
MHRIMLVDDEVVITTQLGERLASMGYDVVGTASSGTEAVKLARELKPRLILMDIVMPGELDGIEAAETIKAELGIPVIFLTAYADDRFIKRAKKVEPFGYILKPFNEDQIRATIEITFHKKDVEESLRKSSKEYRALIERLLAVVGNITEETRSGKSFPQAEKLRALSAVVAGLSHEFNSLFAVIQSNPQLLEGGHEEHKEITEGLNAIRKVTQDGAEIIHKMYESTRPKADSSRFVPVNMRGLIQDEVDFSRPMWKEMAQARGITFDIDLGGLKKIPTIEADPSELRSALENIINNALDAMPEGGRLSFRSWRDGDYVCVSISDTGVGMSKKARESIFEPFFSTKTSADSGLGMSIVYSIITRHGGKIDVESEEGKGSTITLRLPIIRKPATAQPASEPS